MPESTETHIQRHPGRRGTDALNMPQSELRKDKNVILMSLLTGMVALIFALVGYLCLESKKQSESAIRMEEKFNAILVQNKNFQTELERQYLTVNRVSLEMKDLQIEAAVHGWKVNK